MAVNNFNLVAPFYDFLAKLVFGNALDDAQALHLAHIDQQDQVLILGGGTGRILNHLSAYGSIDYVEKSNAMISRAQKRDIGDAINFIQEDFFLFETRKAYDVIICPFFLDCFSPTSLSEVVTKCKALLKMNGLLIVVDFHESAARSLMMRAMHLFFRAIAKLESRKLDNIHESILSLHFELIDEKKTHRNQVFSRLYRNL